MAIQDYIVPSGGGLYIIWLSDRHYYGGRTVNFKRRWDRHLRNLLTGTHDNSWMQRAFNKYGQFRPEVLKHLSKGEHQAAEQEWLDKNYRKPGCVNLNPRADGGCAPSAAEKLRGRKQSPEVVERRASSNRGRRNTPETLLKMSESAKRRAKRNPTSHGLETRALISSQQKGRVWVNDGETNRRVFPDEAEDLLKSGWFRGRMSRSRDVEHGNLGRKHTPEAKQKMSASRRGRKRSLEAIEKTAEANRGQKRTAESRARMSRSAKEWWSRNRGLIWINNGTRNKRVSPDVLSSYLGDGWFMGFVSNPISTGKVRPSLVSETGQKSGAA